MFKARLCFPINERRFALNDPISLFMTSFRLCLCFHIYYSDQWCCFIAILALATTITGYNRFDDAFDHAAIWNKQQSFTVSYNYNKMPTICWSSILLDENISWNVFFISIMIVFVCVSVCSIFSTKCIASNYSFRLFISQTSVMLTHSSEHTTCREQKNRTFSSIMCFTNSFKSACTPIVCILSNS